jgi:ABC-type multidrug transport system ATPase subunit
MCDRFVQHDDCHSSVLTVRETLTYAAQLHHSSTRQISPLYKPVDVTEAVETTLTVLGLLPVADVMVGTSEQQRLSSGQRRRLTIGCSIVNYASLIFMDQPTSGLDGYYAATVVEALATLAKAGRTILCSLQQVSTPVFLKFHKVSVGVLRVFFLHTWLSSHLYL